VTTPGYVRLTCDDPALDVTVLLGPDPVHVTSGVGGWQVTARPRQVGMTTWAGVEPIQLSLSLMFDGWASSRSQEALKTGTKLRVPVADTTKHKARGRKGTGHATKRDA
jgi:hypothetical protein